MLLRVVARIVKKLFPARQLACLPASQLVHTLAVSLICTLGGTLIIIDNYSDQLWIIMEQQAKFLSVVACLYPGGVTPWSECEAKLQPLQLHPAVCLQVNTTL